MLTVFVVNFIPETFPQKQIVLFLQDAAPQTTDVNLD